jgi:rhodanese-related sulfurtransferase
MISAKIPKDKPVISVCHAAKRSVQATVILRDAGVPK